MQLAKDKEQLAAVPCQGETPHKGAARHARLSEKARECAGIDDGRGCYGLRQRLCQGLGGRHGALLGRDRCDGQGLYDTTALRGVPVPGRQDRGDLCPSTSRPARERFRNLFSAPHDHVVPQSI
jgi:hypothetical protein